MSVIENTNKSEYDELIKTDKLTVVDFSAEWCGPCKRIAPAFAELAAGYQDVNFVHIDIDSTDVDVSDIQGVPTFRFYRNGDLLDQFSGASSSKLTQLVEMFVNAAS